MEKKGEILNQLAIIADLVERTNLDATNKQIVFIVTKEELDRIYKVISLKTKEKNIPLTNTFSIRIGEVDIIFNMNNV